MRKAVMGIGSFLIVVGIVVLVMSLVAVSAITPHLDAADEVMADAVGAVGEAGSTLRNVADDLSGVETSLADLQQVVDELDLAWVETGLADLQRSVDELDLAWVKTGLADLQRSVDEFDLDWLETGLVDLQQMVDELRSELVTARDEAVATVAELDIEITADDLDGMAATIEELGLDATPLRELAASFREEGLAIVIDEELVRYNFDLVIEAVDAVSRELSVAQEVIPPTAIEVRETVSDVLTSTQGVISTAIESLKAVSDTLSSARGVVPTAMEAVDAASAGLTSAKEVISTAKTGLRDLGRSMDDIAVGIERIDIGGMVKDGVGFLRIFLVFTSILFMATGAGLLLVGIKME